MEGLLFATIVSVLCGIVLWRLLLMTQVILVRRDDAIKKDKEEDVPAPSRHPMTLRHRT